MTLTRANAEAVLVKRIGALFANIGLDGTTVDGTNTDLNDPIAYALTYLGYGVTDYTSVTDADMSSLSTDNYNAFFDIAEMRCLETALNVASNLVSITVGPRSEQLGQIADSLKTMIANKKKSIQDDYGLGIGTISTGNLLLDFARHSDDTVY